MVLAVGSGWLSSFDNKVTFPWEAAWESRGRLSRAAGPPPPREETTEGHQPAGGGGAGAAQVKLGGGGQEEEGASKVLSTGAGRGTRAHFNATEHQESSLSHQQRTFLPTPISLKNKSGPSAFARIGYGCEDSRSRKSVKGKMKRAADERDAFKYQQHKRDSYKHPFQCNDMLFMCNYNWDSSKIKKHLKYPQKLHLWRRSVSIVIEMCLQDADLMCQRYFLRLFMPL